MSDRELIEEGLRDMEFTEEERAFERECYDAQECFKLVHWIYDLCCSRQ